MVINNNEHNFKGKTLQEYLEWKYPTKEDKEEVREIMAQKIKEVRRENGITEKLEGGELDLRKFKNVEEIKIQESCLKTELAKLNVSDCVNLTKLDCSYNNLTSLDVSQNINLTKLDCYDNNLTSIDFLNQLPHPEKLTCLRLANNNIQPTNLEFLRPFVNLETKLTLGNDKPKRYNNNLYNRFYGSLEPLRNMTKLWSLCIDGTDVEEGIEYLSVSVNNINCSPMLPNQKVVKIQDQLKTFNYDLEAWQLAHPEKMLISHPECFTNPNSKDKWLTALNNKILQVREEIIIAKTNETDKTKKISCLESKLQLLENELHFLARENKELRTNRRELEIENFELKQQVSSLTQKLEQINLISQVEVLPK